jgi:hypothetical protein
MRKEEARDIFATVFESWSVYKAMSSSKAGAAMIDVFAEALDGFPWFAGAMLAFESCEVMGLRLAKLAVGDLAADNEARLMVSEKVDAMFEAGASLMAGASPAAVIGRYREHVAANVRRLSRT